MRSGAATVRSQARILQQGDWPETIAVWRRSSAIDSWMPGLTATADEMPCTLRAAMQKAFFSRPRVCVATGRARCSLKVGRQRRKDRPPGPVAPPPGPAVHFCLASHLSNCAISFFCDLMICLAMAFISGDLPFASSISAMFKAC